MAGQLRPLDVPDPLNGGFAPGPLGMRRFASDQVEAMRVLGEEVKPQDAKDRRDRRLDACHLSLRYYDTVTSGATPSVETVIATARKFEQFLLEP